MVKPYLAEAFGTFSLVFAGTGAIIVNDVSGGTVTHLGIAVTFGLVVTAMVYAVGSVSGAHINPAVTIGLWVARRFNGRDVMPYVVSQLVGAALASGLLRLMFPEHPNLGATLPAGALWQSFVLEIVLTCTLMSVILSVPSAGGGGRITAACAIGGVVALGALWAGPISGASMNPARSIAPAVVSGALTASWMYVVAPVVGGLLAVIGCRCTQPEGCCSARSMRSGVECGVS
ncbi:MAG: aquaporin [Acidobacteria bacterium]|nr:aquaporin [Acidobacteriota bacterium]